MFKSNFVIVTQDMVEKGNKVNRMENLTVLFEAPPKETF